MSPFFAATSGPAAARGGPVWRSGSPGRPWGSRRRTTAARNVSSKKILFLKKTGNGGMSDYFFPQGGFCSGSNSCCSSDRQCVLHEGDCDSHSDCAFHLACGSNNCNGASKTNFKHEQTLFKDLWRQDIEIKKDESKKGVIPPLKWIFY